MNQHISLNDEVHSENSSLSSTVNSPHGEAETNNDNKNNGTNPATKDEMNDINNIQYSIPVDYQAQFYCKTLQGAIFLLTRRSANNDLPKYLALKQAFKKHVHNNVSLNQIHVKENFLAEYTKLLQLQSLSCVVKIYHPLFQDKHSYYFSAEFAKYGDLLSYLNNVNGKIYKVRRQALYNNDAINSSLLSQLLNTAYDNIPKMFYQICKNVYKLHSLNCAHLDISLENIVLTADPSSPFFNNFEHLKFIDFGVAQIFDPNNNNTKKYCLSLNKNNKPFIYYDQFVGKANYMAPEVWRCHLNEKCSKSYIYDPFKADVWSLGVILYLLYCNKYPFCKKTIASCNDDYSSLISQLKYENIPSLAIDLLSKIFVDETKRLNIQQVLEHEFFRTYL